MFVMDGFHAAVGNFPLQPHAEYRLYRLTKCACDKRQKNKQIAAAMQQQLRCMQVPLHLMPSQLRQSGKLKRMVAQL